MLLKLTVPMGFEIKDKVAIITGGASGLGFEHAKELLRNGLRVNILMSVGIELPNPF